MTRKMSSKRSLRKSLHRCEFVAHACPVAYLVAVGLPCKLHGVDGGCGGVSPGVEGTVDSYVGVNVAPKWTVRSRGRCARERRARSRHAALLVFSEPLVLSAVCPKRRGRDGGQKRSSPAVLYCRFDGAGRRALASVS